MLIWSYGQADNFDDLFDELLMTSKMAVGSRSCLIQLLHFFVVRILRIIFET